MSSRIRDAIFTRGNHQVGTLNTLWPEPLANGAKALADFDNFILVERAGYDTDGNITCQPLSAVTNKGYLVATVEEEHLLTEFGETYVDFYNATGEMVNLIILRTGVRFETSAFTKNTGVTTMTKGMVAHFDPTSKTFIISAAGTPHADYATAVNKFELVHEDSDFGYNIGKATVRLMAI